MLSYMTTDQEILEIQDLQAGLQDKLVDWQLVGKDRGRIREVKTHLALVNRRLARLLQEQPKSRPAPPRRKLNPTRTPGQ